MNSEEIIKKEIAKEAEEKENNNRGPNTVEILKQKEGKQIKGTSNITNSPLSPKLANKKKNQLISEPESDFFNTKPKGMDNFRKIMKNNQSWAADRLAEDINFFNSLVDAQTPEFLWIGCADSRVPANQICGLKPGEIFVHRNVANLASPSDINFLAVLQFSVQVLKVKDIIVTGHYGCGGIKASFKTHDHGALQSWLSHIRELRWQYRKLLVLPTQEQNQNLLCELNVKQQALNVARVPIVQQAWKNGQELRIHAVIYSLQDGLLKDLGITISQIDQVPKEYVINE